MRSALAFDNCPAARALDVVGERWALLIVREALDGATRFDDYRARLPISEHTLSRRLSELVDVGVLVRRQYSDHPPRSEYVLTASGQALGRVLAALGDWGETWTEPDPAKPAPRAKPSWA